MMRSLMGRIGVFVLVVEWVVFQTGMASVQAKSLDMGSRPRVAVVVVESTLVDSAKIKKQASQLTNQITQSASFELIKEASITVPQLSGAFDDSTLAQVMKQARKLNLDQVFVVTAMQNEKGAAYVGVRTYETQSQDSLDRFSIQKTSFEKDPKKSKVSIKNKKPSKEQPTALDSAKKEKKPFTKTVPFYVLIGLVVAGGATAAAMLAGGGGGGSRGGGSNDGAGNPAPPVSADENKEDGW